MSSVYLNASSEMWTPLPDRFIDEHLVEMFPLFDQAWLQLVNVMNPAAIHTPLQLPPNLVVYRVQVRTVGWPKLEQRSLVFHKLTAAWSHTPCGHKCCPIEKSKSRQTGREWSQKLLMKQGISIILVVFCAVSFSCFSNLIKTWIVCRKYHVHCLR